MPSEIEQFRFIVEYIPDAVLLSDLKGRICCANTAACELLSCDLKTILNMSMQDFDRNNWTNRSDFPTSEQLSIPQNAAHINCDYHLTNGSQISVELTVSQVNFDGTTYIITTVRNEKLRELTTQHLHFLGKSIENSPNEVFIFSEATLKIIYANHGARKNTLHSREELQSMCFSDLCQDIDENYFYLLTSSLDNDEKDIIKFETEFTRKDHVKYPVLVSVYKSKYLSFNVFIVQAMDISEKVQQKATIKEAFDIINRSKSITFVWQNEEGLPVSYVSDNVTESFGYKPADFLLQKINYADIVHPDDLPRVLQDFRENADDDHRTAIDHEPYRIVTSNKEERWVKVSSYIQRNSNGKVSFFQGIVEDITKMKQHEDELFRSNILLEKTFQSISDIVLLLDPEFRIIKINRAGRRLLDRPQDEIIGSYCHEFFPGNDSVCNMSQELFDSPSLLSEEIYLKPFNKYFMVSYAPIFDDYGEIIFIVHVLRDISERKQMQERLFLTEKMTTIASLAAGVAHEINTPLSAILQSLQIVQMGFEPDRQDNRNCAEKSGIDLNRLQEYIQTQEIDFFMEGMKDAALKAAKIISNLLNFSRPQKGDKKSVSINELLDNSLDLAKTDYDLKKRYDILHTTINREYDPDLPSITCIPMEIEQVFLNLIKNSVHALADTPSDTTPSISIRTLTENSKVVVHFEDNGPGIDPKILPHIFDPFFTTKEVGVGTGLGLSLSYSIIHDKHYGDINVESELGRGTRFVIELPLDRKEIKEK